ncbi:MAG: UTP--glucose-1-phosphate uridylyltransferase GalU [Bacillota bacterium]|nr:UTP--glucose-1-phosphate uridylyltransferase GalU [Bacillota bacterium]
MERRRVRKAIIPAAGLGTRFLPATKAIPKEMLPIVDIPTIQYIVEEALQSGIEEILIVTGKSKRAIEDHFDFNPELDNELEKKGNEELLRLSRSISNLVNLHFVRQKQPRGLGHAVLCAKTFVGDEPFAVLLGDDVVYHDGKPCLKQMMEVYEETGASVLGVQTVAEEAVSKYGIVDGKLLSERIYSVEGLVEKPRVDEAPSNVAILGRYIINPTIFPILERTGAGVGGEIQLTDGLLALSKLEKVLAYDFMGKRYDVGTKIGFLQAGIEFALRRSDLRDEVAEYIRQLAQTL